MIFHSSLSGLQFLYNAHADTVSADHRSKRRPRRQ
ncbi:mCG1030501 [Mus musculus]|nr:mCG1030501 [Mus musculus]